MSRVAIIFVGRCLARVVKCQLAIPGSIVTSSKKRLLIAAITQIEAAMHGQVDFSMLRTFLRSIEPWYRAFGRSHDTYAR